LAQSAAARHAERAPGRAIVGAGFSRLVARRLVASGFSRKGASRAALDALA
jgi:hypothetical protein